MVRYSAISKIARDEGQLDIGVIDVESSDAQKLTDDAVADYFSQWKPGSY